MEDRFRFRAFYHNPYEEDDCDNKKMFYDAENTYDYLNGVPASSFGDIIDSDFWTVEQCTGLKDKNGKLIYEGDILKISSNTDREVISPVVWDDEETGFCVKYKEELFRFNTYRKYNKLEIVGNIHEKESK